MEGQVQYTPEQLQRIKEGLILIRAALDTGETSIIHRALDKYKLTLRLFPNEVLAQERAEQEAAAAAAKTAAEELPSVAEPPRQIEALEIPVGDPLE